MNATSKLATYQFQDILTYENVTPVNFPRTRDQFNTMTRKNPHCSLFLGNSDLEVCSSSSHSNADSVWTWR